MLFKGDDGMRETIDNGMSGSLAIFIEQNCFTLTIIIFKIDMNVENFLIINLMMFKSLIVYFK